MHKDDIVRIETFVRHAGKKALLQWQDIAIEKHADEVDVTTSMDKEIEKSFYALIAKHFSDHGFSGEEFSELKREGEYVWCIDPIDGTKFYAQHIPFWRVAVALLHHDEAIFSCIYDPMADMLYTAQKDKGAFVNEEKIHMTNEMDLGKVQVCLDMPIEHTRFKQESSKIMPVLEQLFSQAYRVRILGSGATGLTWLSQGFFGAYINLYRTREKFYDLLPGLLIAKEAGAGIYEIKTSDPNCFHYAVAPPELLPKLISILEPLK